MRTAALKLRSTAAGRVRTIGSARYRKLPFAVAEWLAHKSIWSHTSLSKQGWLPSLIPASTPSSVVALVATSQRCICTSLMRNLCMIILGRVSAAVMPKDPRHMANCQDAVPTWLQRQRVMLELSYHDFLMIFHRTFIRFPSRFVGRIPISSER